MRVTVPVALVVALLCADAAPARATAVERFALIVGHNSGGRDQQDLQYAESDAAKVYEVLGELGGFARENMVLLRGKDAGEVRSVLLLLRERIRAARSKNAVLFVYYSGHADARELHLGESRFPVSELSELVGSVPAGFRVLVLDSCRSGALTRVKGGKNVAPYSIALDQTLSARGSVVLTASALDEDAQESDQLRGSFFTHYLVSALHGAADVNQDGSVDLAEAYDYTYRNTLRASSRTLAGVQHPTFEQDLRGRGALVLTRPSLRDGLRGGVEFEAGLGYLVFAGDDDGPVVAEVGERERVRTINLKAGIYFVVARDRRRWFEGKVAVKAGESIRVESSRLDGFEYARLARKGRGDAPVAHGVQAGYRARSSVHDGGGICHGVMAGYTADLSMLTLGARVVACRGSFENQFLEASNDEIGVAVRAVRSFDLPVVTLTGGVTTGASVLIQSFDGTGEAPRRTTAAWHGGGTVGVSADLGAGFSAGLDFDALVYIFKNASATDASDSSIQPQLALSLSLFLGKYW